MWRLTTIAFVAGTATLCAAEQSAPAAQSYPATKAETKTVTGCLRTGDRQNAFVLAVIDDTAPQASAQGDRSTSASPQATGTAGAAMKTITYQLVTDQSNVELRKHVGTRVQVTGRLDPAASRSVTENSSETTAVPPAIPQANTTPVVTTSEKTKVQVQTLHVTSIKPVGGSCP
jgi:hypothetical protein